MLEGIAKALTRRAGCCMPLPMPRGKSHGQCRHDAVERAAAAPSPRHHPGTVDTPQCATPLPHLRLRVDVGAVGFLFGFVPHVFFADQAAELIGWPKGSMFQFEVGLHDGGWGILGFLCVLFGGGFWLATAIGWSFFMFGAAWGHFREIIVEGNFAPYNLMPAFTDTFIPLYLLGLLYTYWRAGGLDGKLRLET